MHQINRNIFSIVKNGNTVSFVTVEIDQSLIINAGDKKNWINNVVDVVDAINIDNTLYLLLSAFFAIDYCD